MQKMTNNDDNVPACIDFLRPFVHQVTGRSHMLSLNSNCICKTLRLRELLFYKSMPKDLQKFIPKYKGVLYAQLQSSRSDSKYDFKVDKLFIRPGCEIVEGGDFKQQQNISNSAGKLNDFYKSTLFKGLERHNYDMSEGFSGHHWTIDRDFEPIVEFVGANPWAMRQHRREINHMLSMDKDNLKEDEFISIIDADGNHLDNSSLKLGYLLLEDVTEGFEHPSVIDFKLGRQIERVNRTLAKKIKHNDLVKMSTTGSLMLRLAGMQVYQIKTGHYICRDKYYGRGLSSTGLQETVLQFFNNGKAVVSDVIPPIIQQIKELKDILMHKNTFRFYASSLLIIYEGASCDKCVIASKTEKHTVCCCRPRRTVVKLIDFAAGTFKGFSSDIDFHEGPDLDCVKALDNLIGMLSRVGEPEKRV